MFVTSLFIFVGPWTNLFNLFRPADAPLVEGRKPVDRRTSDALLRRQMPQIQHLDRESYMYHRTVRPYKV